jgi:hypothetical protein
MALISILLASDVALWLIAVGRRDRIGSLDLRAQQLEGRAGAGLEEDVRAECRRLPKHQGRLRCIEISGFLRPLDTLNLADRYFYVCDQTVDQQPVANEGYPL